MTSPQTPQTKTGASIIDSLWSGESVWCRCKHHLSCHYTNDFPEELVKKEGYAYAHCFFKTVQGVCKCKEFRGANTIKLLDTRKKNEAIFRRNDNE
jgi:hypothetical protein